MHVREFVKEMLLLFIESLSILTGMYICQRLVFRLTVGYWCRHYTWTDWERVNDYGLRIRQCESCKIRETKR